jgi:hypothetical protein
MTGAMTWAQGGAGSWPTIAVVSLVAFALIEALLLPRLRMVCVAIVLLSGSLAIIATVRQQRAVAAQVAAQTVEARKAWTRLDGLGALAGAEPGADADDIYNAVKAKIAALDAKIADRDRELARWKERAKNRLIDAEVAAQMADYLRPFGSHRVVVSCVPKNIEAYNYANQTANILRAAGWDALGPETTAMFGNAPSMSVNVYVRGGKPTDAARILLDAFAKFNIPYQSRVEPSRAIPDSQTVELFVATKP